MQFQIVASCKTVSVLYGLLLVAFFTSSCRRPAPSLAGLELDGLFTRLPSDYTDVSFVNRLTDSETFNVITYRNYYDGGGVGLGDLNNDGLLDIYLTANQEPNRLYINRGDLQFEDVTGAAGVDGKHSWATGVSIADVNADGLLDVYVCNSGEVAGDDRANELFINQGVDEAGRPRFEDQAAEYGLDDKGYSTHAAFFDYDRDGDLDLYLMNNASSPIGGFEERNVRHVRHELGGDKLFRNDGGRFTDVSEAAGIYGSEIGFGLGVTVGDVDKDGWQDIYVSNDFFERDYLYVNNGDGTFREEIEQRMPHVSLSSMGADMADINNDGLPEIYVTDMLPESDRRLKTTSSFNSWRAYRKSQEDGFHFQLMRNMLHLNNGDGTFSEIGQLAGVSSTDWSWSALIADYDLDGFKDVFVANGVFRDLTNQDFDEAFSDEQAIVEWIREHGSDFRKLLELLPSTPIPNYAFKNNGDLTFSNRAAEWGLATPGFSTGAAHGDLDNDGDLDLVVNNVNQEVDVYRNESDTLLDNSYLQIKLVGDGLNREGIGTVVTLYRKGELYYQENVHTRGFQSSVDPVMTFGLGSAAPIDSVEVVWPDDRVHKIHNVAVNQRLILDQRDAEVSPKVARKPEPKPFLTDVSADGLLDHRHQENEFVDFDREPLLPKMLSTEGPRIAAGDVDGDDLSDVYVGGAKGSAGVLYRQTAAGRFEPLSEDAFEQDRTSEDTDAVFLDVENDGDLDLYVVSGGNEFSPRAPALRDRLYLNDGRGRFEKSDGRLPALFESGSVAAAADYDDDGDTDLLIGGRSVPWRYGYDPKTALLRNDGSGTFADVTETAAPGLASIGLVTDATWTDYDRDGRRDLIVVGEWMPVSIFRNIGGGHLENVTARAGLGTTHGWWNRLLVEDLDGDGDFDLVVGNLGRNTRLHASEEHPLVMHVADIDGNGYVEHILSSKQGGGTYPIVLKKELEEQVKLLEGRFEDHEDFAGRTVTEIFTEEELTGAVVKEAYELSTTLFVNRGDGTFSARALPLRAQFAPVYAILADDYDGDGHKDLVLAGNFFEMRPQIGRMDASYGLMLRGDGRNGFTPVAPHRSGFKVTGQVRDLVVVETATRGRLILVARNDAPIAVFAQQALTRWSAPGGSR